MQLQRITWTDRLLSPWRSFSRAVVSGIAALRAPPPRPGVSSGRIAGTTTAQRDLSAIASSPAVFAALTRNALAFTTFPIRIYRGFSIGGDRSLEPLPSSVPWVASLLRLLQTPDAESADELAPEPGEALIAQVYADLDMAGVFFVVPTLSDLGDVIGLRRLHPDLCTIERRDGRDWVVYRTSTETRQYPRRSVFVGHLLSWAKDGRSEIGVGAGAALWPLNRAEETAWRQTATVIEQGGADLRVVAKSMAGQALLKIKENRDAIVDQVTEALRGKDGRRVYAIGGDVEIQDAGFKPSDLQAEKLLDKAPRVQMMAVGTVPAAIGMDASNYANGVLQWRAQADMDEGKASVIESALLRPLARRFARQAGGRWAARLDEITARHDLSGHIGYAYVRTDALQRVHLWMRAGWTNTEAAAHEGLDVLPPTGTVMLAGQAATPGPDVGSHQDGPRRPVGDQGDPALADTQAPMRTIQDLFGREREQAEAK
jgi:hypothetical protein